MPEILLSADARELVSSHFVQIFVESDSHDMYDVLLPDDDWKYPLEMWPGPLWFGPLDPADAIEFTRDGPDYPRR